nr:hypothetical protein [Tanacetum cinerariifolium]
DGVASFGFDVVVTVDVVCLRVSEKGTKSCASGLKHVKVVVAVPSSMTALKQYLIWVTITDFNNDCSVRMSYLVVLQVDVKK